MEDGAVSWRLRLAEVVRTYGHFVQHRADLLPFGVQFLELRRVIWKIARAASLAFL
jgi:hypothetical protein